MRDIARASGYSIGNIYNHYKTKEDIYVSLIKCFETRMAEKRSEFMAGLGDVFDLRNWNGWLGRYTNRIQHARLLAVDVHRVVEFRNRHFAGTFHSLQEK